MKEVLGLSISLIYEKHQPKIPTFQLEDYKNCFKTFSLVFIYIYTYTYIYMYIYIIYIYLICTQIGSTISQNMSLIRKMSTTKSYLN